MRQSETQAVLGLLQAYWPRQPLPDPTVSAWGPALVEYDIGDATAAAQLAGKVLKWMPTLAEFLELCTDERNSRLIREGADRPALVANTNAEDFMSFSEFLSTRPDMSDRVKALDEAPEWTKQVRGSVSLGRIGLGEMLKHDLGPERVKRAQTRLRERRDLA